MSSPITPPAGRSVAAQYTEQEIFRRCKVDQPAPFCLIVFGASGDLASRKILPAVFRLFKKDLLPEQFCLIGAARTQMDDEAFRNMALSAISEARGEALDPALSQSFARKLYYTALDYSSPASFDALQNRLTFAERTHGTEGNRLFYLAVPPSVYEDVAISLGQSGLANPSGGKTHMLIEKPFGRDTDTARRLNKTLRTYFEEDQIYRLDHYLAKETVQNILVFRFANSIFEPLWNRRYIDHIQITAAESLGVEHRAGYYEQAGVIRDMFQNHILQLLALTAMEPPSLFESSRVRDEKVKVLRSIRPLSADDIHKNVVTGQYGAGMINGVAVPAYRDEPGVNPVSTTPTYAAMRLHIDNWRWRGVPFYLRSGKRLSTRKAEIVVHFRHVPHLLFENRITEEIKPNVLTLRVQPDEGVSLTFQTKLPGSRLCLSPVKMDFSYPKLTSLDAYERVLLDSMQGDQMLFVRDDGVDASWQLITPVLEHLEANTPPATFPNYAAGSHGPQEADTMMSQDNRSWGPVAPDI